MAHIWSQASRNLGRNRRRSIVTGLALAFGVTLCIATFGITDGMNAQILHSLTRYDLGHVQAHAREYVEDSDLEATIHDPIALMEAAISQAHVIGAAPRLYGFGLIAGDGKSAGVQLVGVDPRLESVVSEIDDKVSEGKYLPPSPTPWSERRDLSEDEKQEDSELTDAAVTDALAALDSLDSLEPSDLTEPPGSPVPSGKGAKGSVAALSGALLAGTQPQKEKVVLSEAEQDERSRALAIAQSPLPKSALPVVVGETLAQVLGAKVGSELFLSTATPDGQNEAVFVKIRGIFSTGTQALDRNRIYLHMADMGHLLHQEGQAHEVSVVLSEVEGSAAFASALSSRLKNPDLLVRPWDEIRPEIDQMIKLNNASTGIMVAIILLVAALGVVNTMLMAVFERTRELGVLKAIGMSPMGIVKMMLAESTLLVLASAMIGVLGGLALDAYLIVYGLDLSGMSDGMTLGNVGLNPVIYGVVTPGGVLIPVIILVLTCLVASLLPAVRAARLQPAIGMRET